jgi:hypothetical protein
MDRIFSSDAEDIAAFGLGSAVVLGIVILALIFWGILWLLFYQRMNTSYWVAFLYGLIVCLGISWLMFGLNAAGTGMGIISFIVFAILFVIFSMIIQSIVSRKLELAAK